MFSIIVRIVRELYGFVEPFCFHSDIKKAIVIYFTLMGFVSELFSLLSGMLCLATLSKLFPLYMVWIGEWHVNGFPQHVF
jgi:hypothetical protein